MEVGVAGPLGDPAVKLVEVALVIEKGNAIIHHQVLKVNSAVVMEVRQVSATHNNVPVRI